MTTLTTERLTLRPPEARDLESTCAFFMSDRAGYVGGPYSKGGAWRAFAAMLGHWQIHGHGMWAVTETGDDTIIGLVGSWCPGDWPETEIGWLVWEQAEGRGIGFEAARAALGYAFAVLDWDTAVSYVRPDNARSIALAQRLGAWADADAPQPHPESDKPVLVFRHPAPEDADADGSVEAYA